MMLLFDTSGNQLAIGIANNDGAILREYHAVATPTERGVHDARLASEAERMLAGLELSSESIDRIGLVIGPGSFTGLRIGLSFAKGLAFARGIPVVPITQHALLAAASEIGSAQSDASTYLVTPGYQKKLIYVADCNDLSAIRLLTTEEFAALPPANILADERVRSEGIALPDWPTRYLEPSLEVLATLALSSPPLEGDAIDALEPLYLTEFKTNAGA